MNYDKTKEIPAGKSRFSDRMDRYTAIPSPYIQCIISQHCPRERVDCVIFLYDCLNGTAGRGMGGAMMYHGYRSKYKEDYLALLLEDEEQHRDKLLALKKEELENAREERWIRKEEERERKREEQLQNDYLKAVNKIARRG